MRTAQSKYGRRFDEEFKREVAELASKPGANQEPVARDLGISSYSVTRGKKQYASAPVGAAPGVSTQELERENRALRRENGGLRPTTLDPKKSSRYGLGSPARRQGVIRSLSGEFPVKALCRALGVSRSGYHAAQKKAERPRARANARLGAKTQESCEASRRTYGSPRLAVVLRRAGETCGRHRVARLRRVHRLRATQRRRSRPRPTNSRYLCPIAPNHLAARPQPPTHVNEVWQSDLTDVANQEGWLHVAGVLNAYSRKIVGWAAADTMPTALVARASERAVAAERPAPGLLHHSDRGSQYASDAYRELLRSHGAVARMSRAGNCYDNAKMESFWTTLKSELIQDRVFASRAQAKSEVFWYIEVFYNRTRLHWRSVTTHPWILKTV